MKFRADSEGEGPRKKKLVRKVKRKALTPERRAQMEAAAAADLPPPGDWRRDVLSMRREELERAASVLNEQLQGGSASIPLDEIEIVPEIARLMDETGKLTMSRERPEYVYSFICHDYPSGSKGLHVRQKLLEYGWEVVQGYNSEFPEGEELLQADGTRRVGDSIALRCKKDHYFQHLLADRKLRQERQGMRSNSHDDKLREAVRGSKIKLSNIDLDNPAFKRQLDAAIAKQIAKQEFTGMLKGGKVPGMVAGR